MSNDKLHGLYGKSEKINPEEVQVIDQDYTNRINALTQHKLLI
ncbi:hypothetical protein [Legionella sp.]